ncbi:MAG: ABC transporter substrate-binding protein [Caldimicrobium sp.]|nr:ABC transporter substrate-binding protein [Caldimicrobium sp.]
MKGIDSRFSAPIVLLLFLFLFSLMVTDSEGREGVRIRDMAGREVFLPKKPERIVALSGSLRYVVYLQAVDKLVGIEAVEKQPLMRGIIATGRPYNIVIREKITPLPVIGEGGPGKLPEMERLLMVKPDVVILYEPDMAEAITSKTGLPTVVIKSIATEAWTWEELKEVLRFLGKLLDREKRAEELINYIEKLVKELNNRASREIATSYYIGAVSARGAHGTTSTVAKVPPLTLLKAKNISEEFSPKGGHLFIDKEALLSRNPDFIFFDTAGLSLVQEDYLKNPHYYQRIKAINAKNVYTLLPINFYRTNLEFLLANTFFIGKKLRPKEYADLDPIEKTREILKVFLGRDVLDEVLRDYPAFKRVEFGDKGLLFK